MLSRVGVRRHARQRLGATPAEEVGFLAEVDFPRKARIRLASAVRRSKFY